MKTYWTSGVMVEVDPRPGELVYYRKDEVDARIATLTDRDLQSTAMIQAQRRRIEELEKSIKVLLPSWPGDDLDVQYEMSCIQMHRLTIRELLAFARKIAKGEDDDGTLLSSSEMSELADEVLREHDQSNSSHSASEVQK